MASLVPKQFRNSVDALRHDMNDTFNRWLDSARGEAGELSETAENQLQDGMLRATGLLGGSSPPIELEETDNEVILRAELPGINKKDIDVEVFKERVILRGEKKEADEKKDKGYYYSETRRGSFFRTVPLPVSVDEQKATAEYKNGILHVKMPKDQEETGRKVNIEIK